MRIAAAPVEEYAEQIGSLLARLPEHHRPFGEVSQAAMAERPSRGRGFGAWEGTHLSALAYATPNPDGTSWMLETASELAPDDYERFLGDVLADLHADGIAVVLWLHDPSVSPGSGMAPDRTLLRLQRDLPVVDRPRWPAGAEVRGFEVGRDEAAWLEVNNAAFADHPEQGGWTGEHLAARARMDWFDAEGVRMVWIDGTLAAFNWTKVDPEAPAVGEIYVIAVAPSYHRRGFGRATAVEGLRYLFDQRQATSASLYVDAANTAGLHLYRGLGFEVVETHRAYRWEAPDR